jgi:hypothetical protein
VGAAANAGNPCTGEEECGGTKHATRFCAPQAKFQKVTGILVTNQLDTGEVDASKEDELCVASRVVLP